MLKSIFVATAVLTTVSSAHAFEVGDQVYVRSSSFYNDYYYMTANVESVNNNRVRVSIIGKCWYADGIFAKPGVYCNRDRDGIYDIGGYYWVNNYDIVTSVPRR